MTDERAEVRRRLGDLMTVTESGLMDAATAALTPDTTWDIAHPINRLSGPGEVVREFLLPLRRALTACRRRDEMFIGAQNRVAPGETWVAAFGHYVGTFDAPLLGLPPSGRLAFLRTGEFYRVEDGRIAEAKIIIDLPDLMRQAGYAPFPGDMGTEMLYPGPATHDGVLPDGRERGEASLDLIEAMIGDLHTFDPDTFDSTSQTGVGGYWHEDMLWYGPGGTGSNYRWDGFVKDHREPFLRAFPDRKGGNHFCRIGDANYAAFSGWPSMTMTYRGTYLGVPAPDRQTTMRVMDFYRCADGKIMENWVMLDYLDLFNQIGVDILARAPKAV